MKSKRLETLAILIDGTKDVIDVGCETAILDIYLAKTKGVNVLGIDINDSSIKIAKENIKAANLEKKIKIIKNNGLNKINCENKIVIIAGLGTKNILKIIKENQPQEVIILTHNDLFLLRKEMCKLYTIKNELVVNENTKYYIIISFEKECQNYSNIEKLLGPIIIRRKDFKDRDYLNHIYINQVKMYQKIPNRLLIKKLKQKILLKKIELYLK